MVSVNVEHNQYMMATIIANHKMYIQRRSRTEPDEIVEYKNKATEAQMVEKKKMAEEIAEKKRALELEAKMNALEDQVILQDAENIDESKLLDECKIKRLIIYDIIVKNTYEDELTKMQEKMTQLEIDAKAERNKSNLTEEELENLRRAQRETEEKLAKEQKEKQELVYYIKKI